MYINEGTDKYISQYISINISVSLFYIVPWNSTVQQLISVISNYVTFSDDFYLRIYPIVIALNYSEYVCDNF